MGDHLRERRQTSYQRYARLGGRVLIVVMTLASVSFFLSAAGETYTFESNGPEAYTWRRCPPSGEGWDRTCSAWVSVAGPLDVARFRYVVAFVAALIAVTTLCVVTWDRRWGPWLSIPLLIMLLVASGLLLNWNGHQHDSRVREASITFYGPSPHADPASGP